MGKFTMRLQYCNIDQYLYLRVLNMDLSPRSWLEQDLLVCCMLVQIRQPWAITPAQRR